MTNEERVYKDYFGEVRIPAGKKWGKTTQRSYENFLINDELMPRETVYSLALVKKAMAQGNAEVGELDQDKADLIGKVVDEIVEGDHDEQFPLKVWQTGSGTQTNMNVNEVIAFVANEKAGEEVIHPNDHVNMGQSTNCTFPTAMQVAASVTIDRKLVPALEKTKETLKNLSGKYKDTIKNGRTHLQDATPVTFGQEVYGWYGLVDEAQKQIEATLSFMYNLPLGGTAVGTGLNCHPDVPEIAIGLLAEWTGLDFTESDNKFHGLTTKDQFAFTSGALTSLAGNLMKIGNDVRWLASGPRSGLGEIEIPANEPGSSIMPGKVNPTQVEALTMVAVQVMGNDTAIKVASSQGNFELNVFMPVISLNMQQSINLLADSIVSFNERCLEGIEANEEQMDKLVEDSLMLVTALSPHIGYDKATAIANKAHEEGTTLREAALDLGYVTEEEYNEYVRPEKMV